VQFHCKGHTNKQVANKMIQRIFSFNSLNFIQIERVAQMI
jgi:hypothetical protein